MGTLSVVLGSLIAAVLAYVFQVFGGRALGPEAFVPITVLWTVQFLAIQVLYQPLEHYVNRERRHGRPPGISRVLLLSSGTAVLTVGAMYLVRDQYFPDLIYVWLAGLLVFGYGFFAYVRGRLAGRGSFGQFGVVTAGEATGRLVAAVVLLWAFGAVGLAWAMVLAPTVAVLWLPKAGVKGPSGELTRHLTPLVGASACAQGLLGLPPLAAGFFGARAATVSIVFMTFAMYRGPLWILQGLMARVMPVFVDRVRGEDHDQLDRWMAGLTFGGLGLAVAAFAAGATIAPPMLAWLIGPEFRPASDFSSFVAAGVTLAACGGLMNQVLLALGRLPSITAAWTTAFAVAVAVALAWSGAPAMRVAGGFLAGEIVAVLALFVLYRRAGRLARTALDARPEAETSVSA